MRIPPNTNLAVQSQKMDRGLKFRIKKKRGCMIYAAKTKKLVSCIVMAKMRTAPLCSHMQNQGFLLHAHIISIKCRKYSERIKEPLMDLRSKLPPTRNWLQAKLTVYPPQCADQNPVNLSKIIFSTLNFFMHIYNMSVT